MLDDLLQSNLKLVICGTAVGKHSGEVGNYYAKPSNKFWRTLFQVGLTPRLLQPAEYKLLATFGIGLTDLVKEQSGMDRRIDFDRASPNQFRDKILLNRPAIVCFNGKKAAELYLKRDVHFGFQSETIGSTRLYVAPSTSGAANRTWNLGLWEELAHAAEAIVAGA